MKWLSNASVWTGFLGAIVGGTITGGTLLFTSGKTVGETSAKLEALSDRVDDIEDDAASKICQTIVSRQVLANEKSDAAIQGRLKAMATEYGCYERFDVEVMAAASPMSEEELKRYRVRERQRHEVFRKMMADIDGELDLHPPLRFPSL